MKIVYTDAHTDHGERSELLLGGMVPAFETPERAALILRELEARKLGPVLPPAVHSLDVAHAIHAPRYLAFLAEAWALWEAEGRAAPCMPSVWTAPGMANATRLDREPLTIDGKLGFFSFDTSSAILPGTWRAVKAACDVALSAADLLASGEGAAFALCRPPGHHAGSTFMGGYCFINNAAAAAQRLLDRGAARVAILDVDYHHGNGTQEIFYGREDVLVVNIHADPRFDYPHFIGFADETGEGAGDGFNLNLPLPLGTTWDGYRPALDHALGRIARFGPDAVVVSLGVDTYKDDPISGFNLDTPDYPALGRMIASLGTPTVFVMEGGYATAAIGVNVAGVLDGFEQM